MRTLSKNVPCPVCGRSAVITLFEQVDSVRGTEGHRIDFRCADKHHQLDEPALLRLWASDRMSRQQPAGPDTEPADR